MTESEGKDEKVHSGKIPFASEKVRGFSGSDEMKPFQESQPKIDQQQASSCSLSSLCFGIILHEIWSVFQQPQSRYGNMIFKQASNKSHVFLAKSLQTSIITVAMATKHKYTYARWLVQWLSSSMHCD